VCGIAGYIGTRELEPARLEHGLAAMRHRGPDAAAHRTFRTRDGRNVYLLSARLDIIDLDERSNQPFQLGSKWLSYNGELYNYLERRDDLTRRGRNFRTTSDTEVLLAALDEDGALALDSCEGMWAFALFDQADESLLLCRDRFGEKPLYLYRDESGLYWGSEPKVIVELLGRRLEPNLEHVCRYLVNGYKALYKDGAEFFHGLEQLPSGTLLRVGADGAEAREAYWQPGFAPDDSLGYDDAVAAVRAQVIRSVELRLRADVPLAFCMSGGVDSLSLISVAKKIFGYDVHGFTVVNTDERYEEQDLVEAAVAELGIRHTSIVLETRDFLPRLRALVRKHDSPVSTITYFAHWRLMESIAEHGYRIAVSGTAADEIFSGYYDHHLAYLYEVRSDPELHAQSLAAWQREVQPLVRNPYLRDPELFVRDATLRDYVFLDAERFAGFLRSPWSEPFAERPLAGDLLRNRMLNELFYETVPVILHEDDLNAMSFSIENRSPYLDRHLFELAARVPTRHLVRNGRAKALLRDAMRGIAPVDALDNPRKVGFNAPIHAFLDTGDPAVRAELLADSPIFDHVRRDRIATLLDEASLPNSQSKFLFYFLNAKLFLEEFGS
jgi:asparagine synthase (glutamine-hydrolysing)